MRQVDYSKASLKTLKTLPKPTAERIRAKMQQYADDPRSLAANVKALEGEGNMLRMRVGDWRVLFTEDLQVVGVVRVAPRGSAYR